MKLAQKQPLIKSLYLKLLITVKHWGRETEDVSDRRSALRASNCVHAGFILTLVGPHLLLLDSTFLLSPPHQLDSFHLCIPLMSSSSFCPSPFSLAPPPLLLKLQGNFIFSRLQSVFQWLSEDRRKHIYEDIWVPCLFEHPTPHPLVLWPPTHWDSMRSHRSLREVKRIVKFEIRHFLFYKPNAKKHSIMHAEKRVGQNY